jgi:hypothetical protein
MTDEAQALKDKTEALLAIRRYVNSDSFQAVLEEFYRLDRDDRDEFVAKIMTNLNSMEERGATPPPGVFISTSEFHDGRPTAFAVCKKLPDPRKRMTITFDHAPTGRREPASA